MRVLWLRGGPLFREEDLASTAAAAFALAVRFCVTGRLMLTLANWRTHIRMIQARGGARAPRGLPFRTRASFSLLGYVIALMRVGGDERMSAKLARNTFMDQGI